jgi:hypothetical protein
MALSPEAVQSIIASVIADELIPKLLDDIDPADWQVVTAEAAGHGLSEEALVAATHRDPTLVEATQRYARERRAASLRAEELALRLTPSKESATGGRNTATRIPSALASETPSSLLNSASLTK